MMNTEEKYDLIEKYLDNKMSVEERKGFEQLLENDAIMKAEVELHRQVSAALKGEKIHEFRSVLKETDKNWSSKGGGQKAESRTINFPRIIAIAATVLLAVMAYQFFFSGSGTVSNEQLFSDNFQPYQMLLSQRGLSEGEKDAVLENAVSTYTKGDFQSAVNAFQQLSESDPTDISYQFYLAVAELGAKNNEKAITVFEQIITIQNNPFKEQSQWYLALAYLQNGDVENAKKTLNEIQNGAFKYAEARQLLKDLN